MTTQQSFLKISFLMPATLLLGIGVATMLFTGCSHTQGQSDGARSGLPLLNTAVASFNECAQGSEGSVGDFATVVGTDSNKNGIRDDVDIAIQKKYPINDPQRRVVEQYARAFQLVLAFGFCSSDDIQVSNLKAYDNIIFELRGVTECLKIRFKDNSEKVLDFVEDVTFDTSARRKARDLFGNSRINQTSRKIKVNPIQVRVPCEDQRRSQ